MEGFLDIYSASASKAGEELCGDQVRVVKSPAATTLILSDGLGSGVKANILATLTTEIIATMVNAAVDLREVIDTVIRTLPVDPALGFAYATFSILTINHDAGSFQITNFDNPEPFFVTGRRVEKLAVSSEEILGKRVAISRGVLGMGDFIGLLSDGVPYAGPDQTMNPAWGWEQIARHLEEQFSRRVFAAHSVVNSVMAATQRLYEFKPGDDATFAGVYRRERSTLTVFTGPPTDNGYDYVPVDRLLDSTGRKVICGGTTANIVASYLKAEVKTDMRSLTDDSPAIGFLPGIDLVTEGIVTLAAALDALDKCQGRPDRLSNTYDGISLLARELLAADAIEFLVGQAPNPALENLLLPKNMTIRRYLVERLAEVLTRYHKDVHIEYY